ncbi:hypothetical protein ACG873_02045 [Mesorhizobium sp. AaZ16]|uniref:hypothetical protein n=1 Tax=Mesorhizobium sp. AaZ16 TaxID=3402289 RepID=UPI00374F34DD
MKDLLLAPLGIIFMLGGPITYILNVVDTWQGSASVAMKLLTNLTLDGILAAIWPITWLVWLIMYLGGGDPTPARVLGF